MKRVSGILLILYLVFTPYFYGATDQLPLEGASFLTTFALLIYLIGIVSRRYDFFNVVGLVPLCLFLLLLLIQLIPLPPLIVEAISPNTYQLYKPLLEQASQDKWISLAIVPGRTLHEFFRYCGYAATYILVQQLFSHRDTIKIHIAQTIAVLTMLGAWSIVANLFSPEPYLFQFVGVMWLLLPITFGLFLYYKPVEIENVSPLIALRVLYKEPAFHFHVFYFCCFVVMMLALFVAVEWGAVFSIYITATLFLVLYAFKFTGTIRPWVLLILLVVGSLVAGLFDDTGIYSIQRGLETSAVVSMPADILRTSLEMIQSFPLLGTGLGSYDFIYHYLAGPIGADGLTVQPIVMRLFLETGCTGIALLTWFLFSFLLLVFRMVKKRGDRFVTLIGIGSISGCIALLLHSFLFPEFYGGASGFYLAGYMGGTVAAVNCRFQYFEPISYCTEARSVFRWVLTIFTFLIFISSILFYGGRWYADYLNKNIPSVLEDTLLSSVQYTVEQDTLLAGVFFDPLESVYSYRLGLLELALEYEKNAGEYLLRSGFKNIMNGQVFQQLALIGDKENSERLELLELGYRRAPQNAVMAQRYGEWLFNHGKREDALALIKEAIVPGGTDVQSWLSFMQSNMVTRAELRQILPQSVELWLELAKSSETNNLLYSADFYYAGALEVVGESRFVDPQWFLDVHGYYLRQKREDMAVLVIRRAITLLPAEVIFHRLLGDYYRKEGVEYRAIEEYEQVLLLDPDDEKSKQALRVLRGQ
ncbi:hypothetical protein [Desulforhopalus sp. 52FAK]